MIDLKLLTSFVAVAQLRHFGKAAASVNATQPGVSQHIAKLEAQLGFKLFERTKRSVTLTPAGEAVFTHAKFVLVRLRRIKEEGQQIASGLLGQLSLGLSSAVIYSDIPQRISAFKQTFPNIEIRLDVHPADYLGGLMDSGQLDTIITTLPMPSVDYRTIVVSRQAMGVALPKSHPLAGRRFVTLNLLKDDPFIVVPRQFDPHGHDTLISTFQKLGATLRIAAYETPSLNTLGRVSIGEGVALLPIGYRSEKHDAVRVVQLKDAELGEALIYASVRNDNVRPPTERLFEALQKHEEGTARCEAAASSAMVE